MKTLVGIILLGIALIVIGIYVVEGIFIGLGVIILTTILYMFVGNLFSPQGYDDELPED